MIARLTRHLLKTHTAFVLGPVLGLASILVFRSTEDLYLDLDEEHLAFVQFGWLAIGLVLGFVLFLHEQLPANREIALQRGTSVGRLYWSRAITGLVLTIVVGLGALILGTAVHLVGPNAALVSGEALGRLAVLGTSAFAGFGLGAWLTTLRGSQATVGPVAVVVLGACVLGQFVLVLPTTAAPAPGLGTYAVIQLSACAAALFAGSRGYLLGNDADRPVPLGAQAARALPLAGAVGLLLVGVLPVLERSIVSNLGSEVALGRTKEGGFVAGLRAGGGRLQPLDESGEPAGTPVDVDELYYGLGRSPRWNAGLRTYYTEDGTPIARPEHGFRLGAATHRLLFHHLLRASIDSVSGTLLVARTADSVAGNAGAARIELARPDGRPFGARPTVVGGSRVLGWMDYQGARDAFFVGDLEDGTLWRVQYGAWPPRIEPVALPDGDRLLGWAWNAAMVRAEPDGSDSALQGRMDAVVLRGARGNYAFDAEGRVATTTADLHPWHHVKSPPMLCEEVDGDPFHIRVRIPAEDGTTAFVYDHEPRTLRERTARGLCTALSLLRPPMALDFVFEGLDHGPAARAVCRPFTALLVALGIALLVARALSRRGAARGRIMGWTLLVLLLGIPGALAFLLFERRAAFAPMPARPNAPRLTVLEPFAPTA